MQLFEFILAEKELRAEVGTAAVTIHVDPSVSRLIHLVTNATYKQVRGIIDDHYMYFWDSYYATHHDMAKALGLEYRDENCAHVWIKDDEVRLDFLDRPAWDLPYIPEINRLLLSDKIFFDAQHHGYVSGPKFIELRD